MSGVALGAAAIGAVGAVAASSASGGGKGGSVSPSSTWKMMEPWAQEKFARGMQGMPDVASIAFGGTPFQSMYGPLFRASKMLFTPQGQYGQTASPGSAGSALAAAAPWAMMAMNNARMTAPGTPNGQYWPTAGYQDWGGADYLGGMYTTPTMAPTNYGGIF